LSNRYIEEYKRHSNREDLAGEYKYGDLGQIVLFVLLLLIWIPDSFLLHYTTELAKYVPLYVRIPVTVLLIVAAVYLIRSSEKVLFREVREVPRVVRESVFSKVRHPLYLGSMLFYAGLVMLTLSIASAFVFAAGALFFNFIAREEEKLLLAKFGEEYVKYQNEVPMWIPGLKG
jgi:protein-S-isoprenylcysteine O-methyltransferase Ste14